MKKVWILLLTALFLAGCGNTNPSEQTEDSEQSREAVAFSDRDLDGGYEENGAVRIQLEGTKITASSNAVTVSGTTVQLTEEATYILSGTLNDGMVVVAAPKTAKLQLVLSDAHIKNETGAAIYIRSGDKVFLTLAEGTENSLENGGSFASVDEANVDGTLFSKEDLTVNGAGTLTVASPVGHGIVGKDGLVLAGGTLEINSAFHAVQAKDSVGISGVNLTATAGKDGIHCENKEDTSLGSVYIEDSALNLDVQGDGVSASGTLEIVSGNVKILAGGGSENGEKKQSDNWGGFMGGRPGDYGREEETAAEEEESSTSMKGLKAEKAVALSGGTYMINSADDGIHSNSSMVISGGSYEIASGDDGIHAEETLTIEKGTVNILESYEGLEALHVNISGGEIRLKASDDGINAAGGTDSSGFTGGRDGMFGGRGPGGGPGGMHGGNSDGSVVISGGTVYINASGDGIDANGTLEISGGHTTVLGPTQGDTATLDYDVSATISGGTFIGTGAAGMAQTFSDPKQGVIAVSVGSQAAGTEITLTDTDGKILVAYAPELSYQVVILSTPEILSGETYTITVGEQSAAFEAS